MKKKTSLSNPLISVIMPAYNRQETIAYAIESVINQTYDCFELILVDDASNDATHNIMQFYKNLDKRIKIVTNETNSRQSPIEWEPRNDGLKVAQGSLIAYLDSDNIWDSQFLYTCSKPFLDNPNLKLLHCDSRNYYGNKKEYIASVKKDPRFLKTCNDKNLSAVYTYGDVSFEEGGISWYIDTNEMIHKTDVFQDLVYLWATWHPNKNKINKSQISKRTYRRHNDQELAERIIKKYGISSVYKENTVLVYFFYANRQKELMDLVYEAEIERIKKDEVLSQSKKGNTLSSLNIEYFYDQHILKTQASLHKTFDFGVGEIRGNFTEILEKAFADYAKLASTSQRLTCYGGTSSLGKALKYLANNYISKGLMEIEANAITPCDGGHNALFHTFQALSLQKAPYQNNRSKILFMVPAYPYWTICAASGCDYGAIEAYDFDSYIEGLKSFSNKGNVLGIVVNTPHNPSNVSINSKQVDEINSIAEKNNWTIIVDIPYHSYSLDKNSLHVVNLFDPRRTIYCDSVSKSLGLPGLRLGFAITKNHDLSALIRAHKSASSLLPSSIKVDFIHYFQSTHPDYMKKINQNIYDKMQRARKVLSSYNFPKPIKWVNRENHTIYDLIYITKPVDRSHLDLVKIDEVLSENYGITVTTEKKLFPPSFFSRNKNDCLVRLAYGKVENIEEGLQKFFQALEEILGHNNVKYKTF